MSDAQFEHLRQPLMNRTTSRTSFKDAGENDFITQNIIISLDNAIKWEKRTKKTPEALKYKKIYSRIQFIKYITLFVYVTFIFFEIPTWCLDRDDIKDYTN